MQTLEQVIGQAPMFADLAPVQPDLDVLQLDLVEMAEEELSRIRQ